MVADRLVWPDASTTGVPEGRVLTPRNGTLWITQPGTVIDGLDVDGCIRVNADDVVIRNTRVRCSGSEAAVWQNSRFSGLLVEDSEIIGVEPSPARAGVWAARRYTLRRTEITNVDDGAFVPSGSYIEGNWIHDLHLDGIRHNDLLQLVGGHDVTIRNNRLEHVRNQTSAVMIKSDRGPIARVEVSGNRIAGGAFSVYVRSGAHGAPTGIRIHDNVFTRDSSLYGPLVVEGSPELRCNTFESGVPVSAVKVAGATPIYRGC